MRTTRASAAAAANKSRQREEAAVKLPTSEEEVESDEEQCQDTIVKLPTSEEEPENRGFLSPTISGKDNIGGRRQLRDKTNASATSLSPPSKRQVLPTSPNLANAKQDDSPSSALTFYQHRQSPLGEVNEAVGYDSSQWRDNKTEVVPNELLRIPQLRANKATLRENNCHPDCHAIRTSNVVQVDVAHFASLSAVDTRLLEFGNGKYYQICWQSQRDVRASILVEALGFTRENAENFIANHIMNLNVIPELMEFDAHSRGSRSEYNAIKERHSESQKTVFESLTDVCSNIVTMSVFGTPPHNTMKEWGFFEDAHALSDLLGDSKKGPIGHMTLLACGIMSVQQRDRLIKHTIEQYCRVFNLDSADYQLSDIQKDSIFNSTYADALISKHVEPHIIELSEQIVASMLDMSDEQIEAVKAEVASWLTFLSTKETAAIVASINSINASLKNRPEGCFDINTSVYKCDKCDNENLTQYNASCGKRTNKKLCTGHLKLRRVMNRDGTMSENRIDPLIPASCTNFNCGHCGQLNSHCTACQAFNKSLEPDEEHLKRNRRTMHCTHSTFGPGSSWNIPLLYETKDVGGRTVFVQTYVGWDNASNAILKRLTKTEEFPVDAGGVHTTDFEPLVRDAFFNHGDPHRGVSGYRKIRDFLSDVIPGEGGTIESSRSSKTRKNFPWDGVIQYGPYRIQSVGTPLPILF